MLCAFLRPVGGFCLKTTSCACGATSVCPSPESRSLSWFVGLYDLSWESGVEEASGDAVEVVKGAAVPSGGLVLGVGFQFK